MKTDVTIIGAGPAGLSCALTLGRAGRDVLLVDSDHGRNRFSGESHGFLTRDGESPANLRLAAQRELEKYKNVVRLDGEIVSVSGEDGKFEVEVQGDFETALSRKVVLAQGVRDVLPEIEGIEEHWGNSVFACPYCHGWEVRGKQLVMIGLTAADFFHAELLTQWSNDVTLIVTEGSGDIEPHKQLLAKAGVKTIDGTPERFINEHGERKALWLASGDSVQADAVVIHASIDYDSELADDLGCIRLDDGAIEIDEFAHTSISGVSAAGDIARRGDSIPGIHFISRAVADGMNAGAVLNQELTFDDIHAKELPST